MQLIVLLLAFVSSLLATPQYNPYPGQPIPPFIPILKQAQEINPDGSFQFSYEGGDGTVAQQQGFIKNLGIKDAEAQVIQGFYAYTSPEGIPIETKYYSDENGFHAEGAHLPTPPPTPEAILRALQFIALNPQPLEPVQPVYPQQPFRG